MNKVTILNPQEPTLLANNGNHTIQRKCSCGLHKPSGSNCPSCGASQSQFPPPIQALRVSQKNDNLADTHFTVDPTMEMVPSVQSMNIGAPGIQAKGVKIGASNDKYEQEADLIADSIVSMPYASSHNISRINNAPIQRASETSRTASGPRDPNTDVELLDPILESSEGSKNNTTHSSISNTDETIQRKTFQNTPATTAPITSPISSSQGSPMDRDVRTDMENRFGTGFDNVRIHNNSQADNLCKSIGALAFTHRNHLYFANSHYQPNTKTGKHLLAHELTHTIQQGATPSPKVGEHKVSSAPQSIQRAIDTSVLLHTHSLGSLSGATGSSGNSTVDNNLRGIESAATTSFGSRNPVLNMHLNDRWRYYADSFDFCRTTSTQSGTIARLANCAYTHFVADDTYDFDFTFNHTKTRAREGSFSTTSGRSASRTTTLTTGAQVSYSILELSTSASSSSTSGSSSGTTVTATNFFEHDYDVNVAYRVKYFIPSDFRIDSDFFPGMDQVGGPHYYRGSASVGSITLYDDDNNANNLTP